jgi:hypothetical protein
VCVVAIFSVLKWLYRSAKAAQYSCPLIKDVGEISGVHCGIYVQG